MPQDFLRQPSGAAAVTLGAAQPGGSRIRRTLAIWTGERVLWLILACAVIAIAIVPLVYVFDMATYRETRIGLADARDLAALLDVYTSREYLGYLSSTLILAAIVTALSIVLGVSMALIIARTD